VSSNKRPWKFDYSVTPPVKTETVIVYVPVRSDTGEMETGAAVFHKDQRCEQADGWEWRAFRLVEVEE